MKKIGVLYGEAEVFATALTDRIAAKQIAEVQVEAVRISKVTDADPAAFAVILDGLSARVPFYRLFLKRAALAGTAVIGNPFLGHGDSGYFPGLLAARLGIAVPRTALLPSWKWPPDTTAQTFRSLAYPLDWQELFTYVGFPALLKPAGDAGGTIYRVQSPEECFARQGETGCRVMLLQEEITGQSAFRVYGIGQQLRMTAMDQAGVSLPDALRERLEAYVRRLSTALGHEVYRADFVIRDNVAYLVGWGTPFPGATPAHAGPEHFSWLVDTLADHVVSRALAWTPQSDQLTWGSYLEGAIRKREFARWQ